VPRITTLPLAVLLLGVLVSAYDRGPQPLHWPPAGAGRQVHTFHTRARAKLAPPPCRRPPGQSAGTRQAHPGPTLQTRFRSRLSGFDTSSMDRSRSPSQPTLDALDGAPFPQTLTTTALDRSSLRWFATSPCRAIAEDHQPEGPAPPSPMQHRIKQSDLLHRASLLRFVFTRKSATFPANYVFPSFHPPVRARDAGTAAKGEEFDAALGGGATAPLA